MNKLAKYASLVTVFACLGLGLSVPAHALKSDRDQPADIEADDTEFNFKTGVRTFIGNVIVIQGTLRIKADKVVANYKDGELQNATAWGKPARFKQRPDGKPNDVEGYGKKLFVNSVENTLTLNGRAKLKQGVDTINGETIVYNMANDTLKVKGGTRIGSGGNTGKARPNRKLEDPFKDDPLPSATPAPRAKSSDGKSSKTGKKSSDDSSTEADSQTETKTTQVELPVPVGRSRLIIQPKPKPKPEKKKKKNTDSDDDSDEEKTNTDNSDQ